MAQADPQPSIERAKIQHAMKKAASYFRNEVASHGGYVYHYDIELNLRWGEGEATRDQIWVQPPGTPTVGLAYAEAYVATGDPFYLEAVEEVGHALAYGQLRSGGWTNCIDFAPQGARVNQYAGQPKRGKDNSSLDDGQTQTALRFMIVADGLLQYKDQKIHACAQRGVEALLAAQLPSGAFPQVWTSASLQAQPRPEQSPTGKFPTYDWRTEGRIKEYWTQPTLNDDVAVFVFDTLAQARKEYQDTRCDTAIRRLGDFLIASQMPEPQPAWAQQCNATGNPIWARAFEPPAIASHESQGIANLLIDIYLHTGDEKYLKPVPRAIEYLKQSRLPSGQLARYYELETNRPLYMQRNGKRYSLTHSDKQLPKHYGWKIDSKVEVLERRLQSVRQGTPAQDPDATKQRRKILQDALELASELDQKGRWVSRYDGQRLVGQTKFAVGQPYLSSKVFAENLTSMAKAIGLPSENL